MVTVTKKHQASLLIAVVLATVMIAGTFASPSFATRSSSHASHFGFSHDGKSATVSQSIDQQCDQDLRAPIQTAGGASPIDTSGIPVGVCLNLNTGGNGVELDQSNNQ
jgi:hypothetical protein